MAIPPMGRIQATVLSTARTIASPSSTTDVLPSSAVHTQKRSRIPTASILRSLGAPSLPFRIGGRAIPVLLDGVL